MFFGGIPTMDYAIDINGIRISLKKEDFRDFITQISDILQEDYDKVVEKIEKYRETQKKVSEVRKDLRNVFWSGDDEDMDALFFKKSVEEIDQKKLWDTLEKHNEFFGFA